MYFLGPAFRGRNADFRDGGEAGQRARAFACPTSFKIKLLLSLARAGECILAGNTYEPMAPG